MHVCGIDFDFHELFLIAVFITYQEPNHEQIKRKGFFVLFYLKSQIIIFLFKKNSLF